MKKYIYLIPLLFVLVCCKSKKVSLNNDEDAEAVTATDFVAFFPEVTLPFQESDTSLVHKSPDSLVIGNKIFNRFIPDSILHKDFGKGTPKLYALGRAKEKGKETYLFVKAVQGNKRVAYLVCFTAKDNTFLGAMPLVKTPIGNYTSVYGLLDPKFQITTYQERKKRADDVTYKKNVYIYNSSAKEFTLIVTEPNEEIIRDVINPIDTLQRKHKYAGDYVLNSRNIVSVRDGKTPSEINFFIHFEKNNGECNGELKGKARFISANVAQYNEAGNPCTIQLSFSTSRVIMSETRGCGTYRDIKCYFEGSFYKKKGKRG